MNSPEPAPGFAALGLKAQGRNWTRRLVNVLVALVVIAVAGATFVFSYAGVHAIALLGGVSAQLARYYPGLFDAVLVIASVTAVMLHGRRWWERLWAWLVIIIVLGAIGTTDVLHAMNYTLRHRPTEGIVAAAPVVAVLLAFSLLLTLLRQSRTQAPSVPLATPLDVPALPAAVFAPPIALPAAPVVPVVPPAVTAATPTEPQDVTTEPTVLVPAPAAAVAVAPPTVPVLEDSPVPDVAPTLPDPVHVGTPGAPKDAVPQDAVPQDAVPQESHAPTNPSEVISAAAPTSEAPLPADEPAPPTVQVPATALSPVPERSQGIRYAGSDVRDTPPSVDYWDTEDTGQFAGLVYPARDDRADPDDAAASEDVDNTETGGPGRKNPPELDDDAPPFATAPFASVPRLNRVRSMPAPPADEDE